MQLQALHGVWQSRGYGWMLNIKADGYDFLHHAADHLILAERGNDQQFFASFDRIARNGDTLQLHNSGDLTTYNFDRISALPDLPLTVPGTNHDALTNFDEMWTLFRDHYAFFDLHKVDWNVVRDTYRPLVTASLDSETLWQVFEEILPQLNDGHVSLDGGDRTIMCQQFQPERRGLQAAFDLPTLAISPRSTTDAVHKNFANVLLAPFADRHSPLKDGGNEIIHWCKLTPRIGYISVLRLFGFADTPAAKVANDIPHDRRLLGDFIDQDLAALDAVLDEVFTDLTDMDGIILDLRINGGGFDRAGRAIAERFAQVPSIGWQKRPRIGDGFGPTQYIEMTPASNKTFHKPVVALQSPLCLSAGEILTLCLQAIPTVTLAGQATTGMLSDNLNKPLPNGWELSLSNEVYESCEGVCYEGVGVPPDHPLTVLTEDDCTGTLQQSLQDAVALLAQQISG